MKLKDVELGTYLKFKRIDGNQSSFKELSRKIISKLHE